MTRFATGFCAWVVGLTFAGCSQPAPSPITPAPTPSAQKITSESVVKAAGLPVEIAAGEAAEATVRVTIQSGYHINANPPTYSYLKATTLDIPPADGIAVAAITYPKPLDKKFPFAEKSLAVYEGETDVKANLKIDKGAKKGERSIPATLRIQACDDQVCYAPGKLEIALPINIK